MCFTHYAWSSPFLSAEAEENEQNVLLDCVCYTGLCLWQEMRHK